MKVRNSECLETSTDVVGGFKYLLEWLTGKWVLNSVCRALAGLDLDHLSSPEAKLFRCLGLLKKIFPYFFCRPAYFPGHVFTF